MIDRTDSHRAAVQPRLLARLGAVLAAAAAPTVLASGELEAEGWLVHESGEQCWHGKLEMAEAAAAAAAFDETSGRNLRNFPPDRLVDHLHLKLEMRFEDLEQRRFTAKETLRVRAMGTSTESLTLDAIGLNVTSVTIDDAPVEHFVDDETITLRFDPPLPVGAERDIIFEYACDDPYAGLFFTTSAPEHGYTAEVHTQGQTITNRHWFIGHDAPNERITSELVIDVPANFQASGNGHLVSNEVQGDRAVWHWLQDKPHAPYLVSMVIGQFDIVEIPHRTVPMQVWVPRGKGDQVMQTYGRTGEMMDVFERRFGVPYPWDRYDQLVVKNFGAGGMENTTATTMYPTAILDKTALLDSDLEGLIAHELAHQWAGDYITCKEWAHIWLNEGFATYGTMLWYEYRDGFEGYLDAVGARMRGLVRRDRTTAAQAMVSTVYDHPWETFRRPGNPYPKGASILHMLRMKLGEDVFWSGMKLYMERHAYGVAETSDFRHALEEVSGRDLEWFFDQWCFRPGSPNLTVNIDYDGGKRELTVNVEQTQTIDARTPAFRFTLPVHVLGPAGEEVYEIDVTERTTSFRTTLASAPDVVAIDPQLHVLSRMDVSKPRQLWSRQVEGGPTIVARRRAIVELGDIDNAEHRERLAGLIADTTLHRSLRNAAVGALTGFGSAEAKTRVRELLVDGVDDARVRVNLVKALDDHDAEDVSELLATIASTDASYDNRSAAIAAIGALKLEDHADLVAELVHFPSQHDRVRGAALKALGELDDPRGLDLALEFASYGYMDRARPTAIATIATLAEHDRDRAIDALVELVDDPQRRPASAAGRALAKVGDDRAVKPLEAMAESHPDPRRRKDAEGWLKSVRDRLQKESAG